MSARAPVFVVALFGAGCGLVSGLDRLEVDGGAPLLDGNAADADASDAIDDVVGEVVSTPTYSLSSKATCTSMTTSLTLGALSLSNTNFTIELWLELQVPVLGQSEVNPILWTGGRTPNEPGWTLAQTSTGLVFCVSDASAATCTSAYGVLMNELVHIGVVSQVVQTSRSVQLFARNVTEHDQAHYLKTQISSGGPATWMSGGFTIGGAKLQTCTSTSTFTIDDVRIYSTALTPNDLDTDMAQGASCSAQNLVASFRFDEGSGKSSVDCSANKYGLTLGDGATFVARPFP